MTLTDHQKAGRQAAGVTRTLSAGLAHHQAGRLQRAEVLYRRALAKQPDHPHALHLLGVVAYQFGQNGPAIELIERALPELQDLPDVHLNLGNALLAAGQFAEAAESYRRAIALRAEDGMAHSNLVRALNEQDMFEPALDYARRATELLPEFAGAHANYAAALVGMERFAEAEPRLRKALALQPGNAALHSDLGRVLTALGRFEEAVACHRQAIELNPDDAATHHGLGSTLLRTHDLAASETSFRNALARNPNFTNSWNGLGSLLRIAGRFEEARSCFQRVLEIEPDHPEAHRGLAVIGQQASEAGEIERLQAALSNSDFPVSRRTSAGFAAGSLLDNADRYDEAFACFAEANALLRQQSEQAGQRFDIDALRHAVDGSIRHFVPAVFAKLAGWGNQSDLPVFIVGMPRSGTTLVEQIAASHSRVFGAGELDDLGPITAELMAHNGDRPVEQWDADHAKRLADQHAARLQALGGGALRVIDKMPDNVFYLGIVAALFPAARIILCQRDPRDTCLSCYFHHFTQSMPWTYDLADCGLRALEVDRLADHWLRDLPLEVLTIDYEELVSDLPGESRRLIEFLGLDWEPACLEFHRTERPVFTASGWQVRQPLFTRSIGRWRRYERHLGPLLEVLQNGGVLPASAEASPYNVVR